MNYQIAIYSSDAVFARMLEIEFLMLGKQVLCAAQPDPQDFSDVVLLDLDGTPPPPPNCYRRIIGFTRNSAMLTDDARRLCSMILHRPFEVRLLRREIMEEGGELPPTAPAEQGGEIRLHMDPEKAVLFAAGKEITLSPKEAEVMRLLLDRRGEAVSREEISAVIGESAANKADVYICFLRRKLEESTDKRMITTVRGQGYRLQ